MTLTVEHVLKYVRRQRRYCVYVLGMFVIVFGGLFGLLWGNGLWSLRLAQMAIMVAIVGLFVCALGFLYTFGVLIGFDDVCAFIKKKQEDWTMADAVKLVREAEQKEGVQA